ncbi:MAG: hypothetical protein ACP5VP_04250 [Candidatus Limnocylindrales bacterium]
MGRQGIGPTAIPADAWPSGAPQATGSAPALRRPKTQVPAGVPQRSDVACEVCRFQADSVERRIGWVEAEGVNDGPFLRRFVAAGGYCPRHMRRVLAGVERQRWTIPIRLALHEVGRQVAGTGAGLQLEPCSLCELERWTGAYGVSILVSGHPPVLGGARWLGPEAFVCLRHAAEVVQAGAGVDALQRLERAMEVASQADLRGALCALAGSDPAARVRSPSGQVSPEGPGRATGSRPPAIPCPGSGEVSPDWLRGEIEAGRCPACSAAACAEHALFERDEPRANAVLCPAHAWDAVDAAPDLLRAGLEGTLSDARGWLSAQAVAAGSGHARGASGWPGDRGTSRGTGILQRLAGRRAAPRPGGSCSVCVAQEAAVGAVLRLLAARPETSVLPPGWPGLCARHLARAGREVPGARSWLAALARSASARLEQSLEPGPMPGDEGERILWEAAAYLAGDGIGRDPWRAPDPGVAGNTIWLL